MVHYVSFPGLFDKVFKLNQVAFHIGNWPIRWYGVILAVAFLLGALYLMKRASKFETDPDTVIDLLIIALPCGVLGARAYYVINRWDYYKDHLNELLSIWNGGLAIYGGVIAGILVVLLFGRKNRHRFNILSFLDVGALGLLIGQIIGRWGNFVNGEAFGTATNLPWGMVISQTATGGGAAVHPTFLYESLWNLLGFTVLHFYSKRRKFRGEIFAWYCVWYGFGRGLIEGLRTDSLYIGDTSIRISQVVGFTGCLIGAIFLIWMYCTKAWKRIPAFDLSAPGLVPKEGTEEKVADCEEKVPEEQGKPEAEEEAETLSQEESGEAGDSKDE